MHDGTSGTTSASGYVRLVAFVAAFGGSKIPEGSR
jgi:hypothetical protein